jgi:hypothetical protein
LVRIKYTSMKMPKTKLNKVLTGALVVGTAFMGMAAPALAAGNLYNAKVTLSTSRASQRANHVFALTAATTATVKCVSFQYATAATGAAVMPTGLDLEASGPAATGTTSLAGSWTYTGAADGLAKMVNGAGLSVNGTTAFTVTITDLINPTVAGNPYYVRINTHTTDTCDAPVDSAVIAFVILPSTGTQVSATVDPTFTFSVAGYTLNGVGEQFKGADLPANKVSNGCTSNATTVGFPVAMTVGTVYACAQKLTVNTNASTGYQVTLRGTHANDGRAFLQMTGTSNDIANHTGTNGTPTAFAVAGSAFGYTSSDATLAAASGRFSADDTYAAVPNQTTQDEIAFDSGPVENQDTQIAYKIRFSATQKAGTYAGTIVYVATPTF